jgi:hypothetical protein
VSVQQIESLRREGNLSLAVKQLARPQVETIASEGHLHPALPCKELAKNLARAHDIAPVAVSSYGKGAVK